MKYEAKGGGYFIAKNIKAGTSTSESFTKVSKTTKLCYRYDDEPPQHCSDKGSCFSEPLYLSSRITRSRNVNISFKSWLDPYPIGGYSSHASSIESYTISVSEVRPPAGNIDKKVVYTKIVNNTVNKLNLEINSSTPVLYRILLEVKDTAQNIRYARRFLLFDNSSKITSTDRNYTFQITSASSNTSYKWQTHHNEICLNWEGYFLNRFYRSYPLLDAIQTEYGISGIYEQRSGQIPVSGTPNVHGIVRYSISWSINNGTYTKPTDVPDFQNQRFCKQYLLSDGDTITFILTPVDIVGNVFSEKRTVRIDRSRPVIRNVWISENGFPALYLLNKNDLTKVEITFEALDPHSGIRNVRWAFGTSENKQELRNGTLAVQTNVRNGTCT